MIISSLKMMIYYYASYVKIDCKLLKSIMYKDITLSSTSLNFENMTENFVKKICELKNKIK